LLELPKMIPVARLPLTLALTLAVFAAALPALAQAPAAPARPRIEKAADLPRFSYPVSGSLEALVRSPEAFQPLAVALRRNTESVLAGYDIPDKATRRDLLNQLALLDFLDGRWAQALARAEEVRALQDKPADKLLSGLRLRTLATAAQSHAPGSEAYRQAVADGLKRELSAMPYDLVQNDIKQAKAGAELMGEALMLGRVREVLQPMASASGALSNEFASELLQARFGLVAVLPLKATLVEAYGAYLARHQVPKPDIWAAREITLPTEGRFTPVPLAVWDSGVDIALFGPQLLRDASGKPLLRGFDKFAQPADTALAPIPPALEARLPQMVSRSKGFADLQANIDSAEATEVKQLLSTLAPGQYKAVVEELGLAGTTSMARMWPASRWPATRMPGWWWAASSSATR
jgi:hypothetical protein